MGHQMFLIRAISKEAEVNVSAINYYFGSKDEMVKNVQAFYIENIVSAYSELDNEELSDEEKLILCERNNGICTKISRNFCNAKGSSNFI